jgi:hypothetical protein
LIHKTNNGTNDLEDEIVEMQRNISSAIFCHICLSISLDVMQNIGAEILCIKMNSNWENLNSQKIKCQSINSQHPFEIAQSFFGWSWDR